MRTVKAHGGRVLVQDPATALAPDMPTAALATGCCDFALPPGATADALTALVMAPGAAELFRVPVPPLGGTGGSQLTAAQTTLRR